MNLGIFGGTFDPIHHGHLLVAETAREELCLDRVWFLLTPLPPHKQRLELTPWQHRLAMLQIALDSHPAFEISTLELQRPGPSYTIDTLRALKQCSELAHAQFYLIIGRDSLTNFHTWREPEAILQLARLVVYPRVEKPGQLEPILPADYHHLHAPVFDISSSEIRRRVKENRSIRFLVPEGIRNYIETHRLYV